MELTGKYEIYEYWRASGPELIGAVKSQSLAQTLARAAARGTIEGLVRWEETIGDAFVVTEVRYREGLANPEVTVRLNGKAAGDPDDDYLVVARADMPRGWSRSEWNGKLTEFRARPELARQQFPELFEKQEAGER